MLTGAWTSSAADMRLRLASKLLCLFPGVTVRPHDFDITDLVTMATFVVNGSGDPLAQNTDAFSIPGPLVLIAETERDRRPLA